MQIEIEQVSIINKVLKINDIVFLNFLKELLSDDTLPLITHSELKDRLANSEVDIIENRLIEADDLLKEIDSWQ